MEKITLKLAQSRPGIGNAGDVVELALSPADVRDPTEMATYLAGYKPAGYRADEVSPAIPGNDEDKFRSFDSDDAFQPVNVKIDHDGDVPQIDTRSSLVPYKVVDRAVGSFVSKVTESNATGLYAPRQAAMRRCKRAIALDRELDVFRALMGTLTNWNSNNRTTLGAGFQWNGGASSDPILNLQTRIEKSAMDVTSIYMNYLTMNAFLRHPKVRDHMKQMLGDQPGQQIVAGPPEFPHDFRMPGFPPFKVCSAKVKNTSGGLDYILEDGKIILATQTPGVPTDGEEIATSYTFRRKMDAGVGVNVREYAVEHRGVHGGTMVVATLADVAVMTGPNCGGLITGAIQ